MIPKTILDRDFEVVEQPNKTYKLNIEKNIITGFTDSIDAMKQAIYIILNTERFSHEIYSWNYGIELSDLFGEPKEFVYPELKRRITEALTQDSRIIGVVAFSFLTNKNEVNVTFTVQTIVGDIQTQKVVKV
jgi:hypothetical protein